MNKTFSIKKLFITALLFFAPFAVFAFGLSDKNANSSKEVNSIEYNELIKETAVQTVQEQNSYTAAVLRSALKELNGEIEKVRKEKIFWIRVSITEGILMAGAVAFKKFIK